MSTQDAALLNWSNKHTLNEQSNSGPALLQIEEAKQVCRRCKVLDDCLRWAIDSGQDAGVWGGMSEDERRSLKRRTLRLRARAGV